MHALLLLVLLSVQGSAGEALPGRHLVASCATDIRSARGSGHVFAGRGTPTCPGSPTIPVLPAGQLTPFDAPCDTIGIANNPAWVSFVNGQIVFNSPSVMVLTPFTYDINLQPADTPSTLNCQVTVSPPAGMQPPVNSGSISTSSLDVVSPFNVNGDLNTTDLNMIVGAILNVTGNADVEGRLTVYYPMTILIGGTLTLGPASNLYVHVTTLPPVMTRANGGLFVTIPIATYGALIGTFANVTVEFNYAVARSSSTTSPCYVPTNSTPIYAQSSLSVVVDVKSCDGGGLSTGAIVGIAVGAAAAGILLIVILAIVLHKSTVARTTRMNKSLRDNQLKDLQHM